MPAKPKGASYSEFVAGLELLRLRLIEAHVVAKEPGPKGEVEVVLEDSYDFVPTDQGFEARARYSLVFRNEAGELARIEGTFGLLYRTQASLKEVTEHFETFSRFNVPLNAWPFAREFFYNMMMRMGWPPFTLPLLHFVPDQAAKSDETKEQTGAPSKKRRAKKVGLSPEKEAQ